MSWLQNFMPTGDKQQQPNKDNQQQPNPPGATLPNGGQGDTGGTGAAGSNQSTGNNDPANPLDIYSKMFDTVPTEKEEVAPTFNLDSKTLDSVTGSMNFMQGLDPELMQKATSGDANALLEIMNHVSRNTYKTVMQHQSALTDKFVGARESFSDKKFSSKVRGELTVNALTGNPNYKHPVVRKQLTEIAERIQKQNPDAAPEEVAQAAKDYVNELYKALNPEDSSANRGTQGAAGQPTNWDTFFDES